MLTGFEDKSAQAVCTFAYSPGGESDDEASVLIFQGRTSGQIVPAREADKPVFGWDAVFQPDGSSMTYAEMDKDAKNSVSHRFKALEKFCNFFAGGKR